MSRPLPKHLQDFAEKAVADGHYPDVDAVIEAGVARLEDEAAERERLTAEIEKGLNSPLIEIDRGGFITRCEARVAAERSRPCRRPRR